MHAVEQANRWLPEIVQGDGHALIARPSVDCFQVSVIEHVTILNGVFGVGNEVILSRVLAADVLVLEGVFK